MAKMVSPTGFVLGLEKVPELAERSQGAIVRGCPDLAPNVWRVEAGNALSGGCVCVRVYVRVCVCV